MSGFKAKMHQNPFQLGLCPRPRWRSLQRSPRLPSWNKEYLLLKEREGYIERAKGGEGGECREMKKGDRREWSGGDSRVYL